jgi:hypothetical protein
VVGRTVRLQVTTPAAGSVFAGGSGLGPSRRRLAQAGTVSLVLHLTPRAAARLRREGRLKLRVNVRFSPQGGRARTILSRSVTMRR